MSIYTILAVSDALFGVSCFAAGFWTARRAYRQKRDSKGRFESKDPNKQKERHPFRIVQGPMNDKEAYREAYNLAIQDYVGKRPATVSTPKPGSFEQKIDDVVAFDPDKHIFSQIPATVKTCIAVENGKITIGSVE